MARNERRHFRERGKSSAGLIKPGKRGGRRHAWRSFVRFATSGQIF